MSTDSSSSEDDYGKIKEAVDGTFLTEDLYIKEKSKKAPKEEAKSAPSLRNKNHQEMSINPFSVKVTPEFQRHVSKHLTKLLDDLIDDTEAIQKAKKVKVKININSGVKLLSSSKEYLDTTKKTNTGVAVRKFAKNRDLKEKDYKERAKQVAVSPEWVLSHEETKYWAPNTKGEVEVIKLNSNYKNLQKKKGNG